MNFSGNGTATGVFSPQEIVDGVVSRNAGTMNSDLNNSPTFFAGDTTETGVKSPTDIMAGVQQRAARAVESGGGDISAIHMAGNDGMFQIEPETAQNYGVADKYPNWQTDPYENAMAGIEVLKAKIAEKDGDLWDGVEHYNGGGDSNYLAKVQAAYETTGNVGSTASSSGGAVYDGIRLTLPDSDAFTDESGNVDGLTEDTRMKLRVLDNLCYQKFGQHLIVSSSYREGDSGNHGAGVAFDVSGGIVDDPEARQWLEQAGPAVGLFVIPEYQGEAGAEFAHGDNVHFSNVEPGIYGQTRDAEGHWSEDHAAPSIQSILNGGNGHIQSNIDLNTDLGSNAFENALHQWENVTIPDTAEALKNTAKEGKDADLFVSMFTVDDTGKDHFQDTKENREAIKQRYGQQIQDAAVTAMANHLLQEPSVQQNTKITRQLVQAVKKRDTAAMTQIARQWFDMKTPNLERERSQTNIAQSALQPIGGMTYETSRSEGQNQANSTEAVPNQNVNTVSGQSREAGTFRENSGSTAAPNKTTVAAEPTAAKERAGMRQLTVGHASLSLKDDSIAVVKNSTVPAVLPKQSQTVLSNGADSMQPQTAGDTRNTETLFADTMQQGRPVIYKGEVAEEERNTGAVKQLQDTLYHKGEAVFNVDNFEAEKKKRGSGYTIQDYAKEWLARKVPNVKRDMAAYQALEKTVTQHMEAAYNLTQKDTKKAADKGGVKLADGYRTESERPLSEADKNEFIVKPDGSKDFGVISKNIAEATHGELKAGVVRLRVGYDKNGKGSGLLHAKAHESDARNIGYSSIEDLIADVANNFDAIYVRKAPQKRKHDTYVLIKYPNVKQSKHGVSIPVYFEVQANNGLYNIITAIPKRLKSLKKEIKKEHLIYGDQANQSTVTPNSNPVSIISDNKVGDGQIGMPASATSNVPSSTSIITKEAEKGNTNDSLRIQLNEEGKQVYDYAVHKLSQGNDQVAKAAKESAFLYARMAERWTEIMHEYGDTTYTPKKYMEQHPIMVGDEKVDHSFGQAMFDVRKAGATTFASFMNKISNRKQAGKPANKIMFTGNSGVIYTEAQVVHATMPHHGHVLSTEQLEDIDKHIDTLQNAAISDKRNTNNFHGIPILAHVKGSMGDYYIVLELDNKGKIWLKIGQPGKEKSIDNIINTKIAEHSARSLSHNAQGRTSQNETAISLSSIQKELANVKEKYEQRAWHGSPYNFNTFDLGAIGKGEGNQAHGWGLYFAKDRNVSEAYKDVLGDKNTSVEVNHTIYRLNEEGDWVGNGNVIEYGSVIGYVLDSMYEMGSREKATADLEDALKRNRIRGIYADEARKAVEILKEGHIKLTKNDRLYEVEILENDVLLDEQKTIGEQPQKVQDAIMDMLFGRNVNAALREAEKKGGAEGKDAVEKALRYISEDESELEARGISEEEVEQAYNKAVEYVDEELLLKAQEEKLSYEKNEKPHLTGNKYKVKELTGAVSFGVMYITPPVSLSPK